MSDDTCNIEQLKDETNFEIWKFQITIIFKSKNIFDLVIGEILRPEEKKARKDWEKNDATAQRIIITTIDKQPLTHLLNCSTSFEMFEKLSSLYERDNQQRKYNLLQEFYSYGFKKGTDMATFICDLENLAYKLKSLKQDINETMIITKILSTLPEQYKHFISAWESTSTEKQNLSNLTSRLVAEEKRFQTESKTSEQVAFNSTGDEKKNNKNKFDRGYKNISKRICFKCNLPGHIARFCRTQLKCGICKKTNHVDKDCYFRNKTNGERSTQKVSFLTQGELDDKIQFLLDSGATSHMVNKKNLIKNLKENVTEIITAKQGEKMEALGSGQLETQECILEDVDYVPDLTKNLLSVSKMTKNGAEVVFKNETVTVYKNKVKILEGKRDENKLYVINMTKLKENVFLTENANVNEWHKKLGHVSATNMLKLKSMSEGLNLKDHDIKNFEKLICETCLKSKQTRKPFKEIRQRATRPLEIIHTDVCGPIEPTTWDGKKYVITFLDDYTHFCMVYLINGKFEVTSIIREYIEEVEAKWNLRTSMLRCDNGKEYTNNELKVWCRQRGIRLDYTIKYSPQLNGKSERLNRTLMDKARALIFESNLDKTMWGEAIRVAAYLINRTPTETVKTTPYEMWNNKKPNLKNLQIFGTNAYAKKLGYLKKLDERSEKLFFIGYAQNGYRLFNKEKLEVMIARDVVFENKVTELKLINYKENEDELQSDDEKTENSGEETTEESDTRSESGKIESVELGRGKRIKRIPRKYEDFVMLTFEEAIKGEDKEKWLSAIEEEKKSLEENETWTLVNKSDVNNKKVLSNRWVFKIKEDGSYKARLVVRGFEQEQGIDYNETFSPVISSCAIRLIFAIAAERNAEIVKFDIKTAFLYGYLNHEVFMEVPKGYENNNKVCKLNKALYGLKQAPLNWNTRFTNFLKKTGLEPLKSERCVFKSETLILAIYVDDGLLIGHDKFKLNDFLEKLKEEFKTIITKNPTTFLGIDIKRDKTGITLSQTEKVKQIIENFNMQDCNPTKIPLHNADVKRSDTAQSETYPYREAIGSLLYLNNKTRPDLSFSVNFISRYMEKPTRSDINNVKHILKYLKGNRDFGIKFNNNNNKFNEIIAYSDADYAGDIDTRKSTTGYMIFYNGGIINWTSRKQPIVALSTTEAEFIAAADCCQNLIYIKNFLEELKNEKVNLVLRVDNKSAMELAKNGVVNKRSKHIDVRYHFIHEKIANKTIVIEYCNTNDQIADILTKPLDSVKFTRFRNMFMEKC